MLRTNRHFVWSLLLIVAVLVSLLNVNVALADDSTPPPPPTEEPTEPPVEPTQPPVAEETPVSVVETPLSEEQPPVEEEAEVLEVLDELPENTEIVVLDENGNPISLASQEALDVILEDDPMWCPNNTLPGGAGCRNFTGANGIVNLLADMRANTAIYDSPATSIIYFTSNPGNGAFTLTDAAGSLGSGDFTTLRTTNITLMGGWNGSNGGSATFTGQTNFSTNYIQVGTAGNPWVGNVTILNMTVDGNTSASNPSIGVYTTTGTVTLDDILVDDADNSESIRISTTTGSITITDTDVTDGDDDYALNLTTTSGNVSLTNVLVDDHTDADAIRVVGGNGTVTFNNVDVTDGDDGDGIDITTTGGTVNLTNVDVDSQSDGNGLNVTTTSGNIILNDTDVQNQENGNTANLVSQTGNINLTNNSDFEGDNNNLGFNASTNTGTITINGTDFEDAQGPGGTNYNGATLTAPIVNLTNVTSDDNDGNGILINATTTVTLNNVSADSNGTNPSGIGNAQGSGVLVNGDGSTIVSVTGGSFNDNERYGIEVLNGTLNFITMPSFDNNGLGPYFPGGQDVTGPVITPVVTCTDWGTNGWCQGIIFVTFNVTEPESRVTSTSGCTGPFFGYFVVTGNTSSSGQTFTCNATSADGTLSSSGSVTVYRDATNPTASASRSPAANASGWNNTDVTVTFSGTDANSGIAFCTAPITLSADGTGQSATGNCTDNAGNVSSNATINNVNIDKTPPTIALLSRTPANGNGWNNGSVTVTWSCTDALSGVVSSTITQTVSTEGANQSVTGTCQDLAGNTSSNTQSGINIDTTPPTLNLPSNITAEATGPSGAAVNYSASASDNLDTSLTFGCSPVSGSTFPLGTTPVTCTAQDDAGNTASGGFNVTVQDTTPPALTLPADITLEATSASGAGATFSASATDIVDGSLPVTCVPPSGSTFPLGTTTVTCTAQDDAGNIASDGFDVIVQDTTPPALTVPANMTLEATSPAGAVATFSASATDIVDGSLPVTCVPPSGSTFPLGTTSVNCSVTDANSNTSSGSFNVTVQDTTAPVITPVADINLVTANKFGVVLNYAPPTTFDIVDGAGVATCSPAPGSLFPQDNTTVTCTATDSEGNTSSITFNVYIDYDKAAPPIETGSGGALILVTGGELIDLECNTTVSAFGVIVKFHNLCDYQAVINRVAANGLPGALPNGTTFVEGLDVQVLSNGQAVRTLPNASGVELNFPLADNSTYAVLHWNNGRWVEIAQSMDVNNLLKILSTDAAVELYKMSTSSAKSNNVLTTEFTGTFILVKK